MTKIPRRRRARLECARHLERDLDRAFPAERTVIFARNLLAVSIFFAALAFAVANAKASPSREFRIRAAIHHVFGPYGDQAVRVASCETGGTFSIWARNGQYLGLFQMGAFARAHYVHDRYWGWWEQIRSAHRYFVAAGHSWEPWSCRP